MAHKGIEASILVDEWDFDNQTSELMVNFTVDEAEHTNLGSTGKEFAPLLPEMRVTQNGYFDGAGTDGFEAEINERLGATGVLLSACFPKVAGGLTGGPSYIVPNATLLGENVQSPVSGLITLNGEWLSTRQYERGIILFQGTISAIGTQAAVDLGSAGSAGGTFYVHVHAITGTATNATIDVESATTEGGAYTSEATVTFSAVGGFSAAMTGTVNRWLRINTTSLGGATDFEVTAIAVVDGVTMPA